MTIDALVQALQQVKDSSPLGGNTQVRIFVGNQHIIRAYRIDGFQDRYFKQPMFLLDSAELDREMFDIIVENNDCVNRLERVREALES